jgi:hypothetical protein
MNHVAHMDLLNRSAVALRPAATGRDYEYLAEWMRMPRRTRTRFESVVRLRVLRTR